MSLTLTQRIQKAFNIRYNRRSAIPKFNLDKEIYAQFKHFRLPLILIQIIFIIGTSGYMLIDDFSFLDALYQTGITFTTVGFGEIAPISNGGRLFTIALIIFGFAIFTLSSTILIQIIVNGRLLELYKERDMLYKIARLRDHFVVFYHNEYTVQLTKQFRQAHIPFVVVDPREDLEEIAKKYKYPYFIKSQTFSEEAFLKSHLASSRGIVSLSKEASENITLIASIKLYEDEITRKAPFLIICSADNEEDISRLNKLGADKVIAPPILMAKRISAMAVHPEMENILEEYLYKKDAPVDLEEVTVPKDSWVVDKHLQDLKLRDHFQISIVAIKHLQGKFISMPKGNCKITAESKLVVIGAHKHVAHAKKILVQAHAPGNFKNK